MSISHSDWHSFIVWMAFFSAIMKLIVHYFKWMASCIIHASLTTFEKSIWHCPGFKISYCHVERRFILSLLFLIVVLYSYLAFMQPDMAIKWCCAHWIDHHYSILRLLCLVLCERRPTFSLFMCSLLLSLFFHWNNFTDLIFKCFFKSLQHLSQVGITSQTLRRPNVIFLGFLFLQQFLQPNSLGFCVEGCIVSDKRWRNVRNKIFGKYPEAEAHVAFQLSVRFSNNPSVMLLKHIPACMSALPRNISAQHY